MAEQESVYLWSNTALTNASSDPAVNFAEGQLPGTLNNSNRAVMAAIARYVKDTDGSLTTGGSANAYTLTINGRMTPLATGQRLTFKANFSNTGAATLAVTNADAVALGTKAIRGPGDVALVSGQMISGGVYDARYDTAANSAAGAWVLLNPEPAAGSVALPYFSANLSAASGSITNATATKIQFNTEVLDSNGWYDNATNYRFTPLLAGKYLVTVAVEGDGSTTVTAVYAYIYKNGSQFAYSPGPQTIGAGAQFSANSVTALVSMNGSTDYLEGFGRINGTGTLTFGGGTAPVVTFFHAIFISP